MQGPTRGSALLPKPPMAAWAWLSNRVTYKVLLFVTLLTYVRKIFKRKASGLHRRVSR